MVIHIYILTRHILIADTIKSITRFPQNQERVVPNAILLKSVLSLRIVRNDAEQGVRFSYLCFFLIFSLVGNKDMHNSWRYEGPNSVINFRDTGFQFWEYHHFRNTDYWFQEYRLKIEEIPDINFWKTSYWFYKFDCGKIDGKI